jgi:carboxyl-terminal processing protease
VNGQSRTAFVSAVFLLMLVTGGWLMQQGADASLRTTRSGMRLFEEVRLRILSDYVDSVGEEELYRRATVGLLHELHDPYTTFLTPTRAGRLAEATSGNYGGVGMRIDVRDQSIVVVYTLPGSPAEDAGISVGDRILEIEGKPVEEWSFDDAMKALRGKPGTKVSFMVERPGVPEPIEFTLVRRFIHHSAVRRASMLRDSVGYLDLKAFSDSTEREVAQAIETLQKHGMRALVLDLRGNPGGLLVQGIRVADLFLDRGKKIVSTRGRTPAANQDYVDQSVQRWPDLELVVLVDENTASASEIVAGALQDHDRAAVIGVSTYGKGSAQSVWKLGEIGAVKLTTARWFTPVGRSISKRLPADEDSEEADEPATMDRPDSFKTDGGRTVFGGGGIVPDVASGDTVPPAAYTAFRTALKENVGLFRDALTAFALDLKRTGEIKSPDFVVTPQMREAVWKQMLRRGIVMGRPTFDEAGELVDRLTGEEIARYVFGPEAEFRRKAATDRPLNAALELLRGATSMTMLLERAESRKLARAASPMANKARE